MLPLGSTESPEVKRLVANDLSASDLVHEERLDAFFLRRSANMPLCKKIMLCMCATTGTHIKTLAAPGACV